MSAAGEDQQEGSAAGEDALLAELIEWMRIPSVSTEAPDRAGLERRRIVGRRAGARGGR